MSALRKPRQPGSATTTRLRKVWCSDCGYTVRMARSWIEVALPACPNPGCGSHGQPMSCADVADAINAGVVEIADLGRDRTGVCRENGWQDEIVRRALARKSSPRQCAAVGCSTFVARGERYCAGHADHEMPF